MGRKWTNIKFKLEDRYSAIPEASSQSRTQEEKLYSYIREEWGSEFIPPVDAIDVMFGHLSEEKLLDYIELIASECEFVDQAGAIFVTDSANVGYGWVIDVTPTSGESVSIIDDYRGAEGAYGADVAKAIYEDHRIKVDESWYW